MDVIDDLAKAALRQETILTIGAFDGVHRGHQALIRQVVKRARDTDRLAALITFYPHPATVLTPGRAPKYLTTPGEKLALLEALQVDLVALLPFTPHLASTSARAFMQAAAMHLRVREVWVGPDFALGFNREGDVSRLRELGSELGYDLRVIQPEIDRTSGHTVISSRRIRALLGEGRVRDATRLLGRYPSVSGEVVAGAQRGRRLGFPTANLEVRPERATPANGVYAVFATLGTARYPAVANVGVRPSFDNGQRTVESHILDLDEDLYGCDLVVEFVARLRDERRFAHPEDLVAQIRQDIQTARRILSRAQQAVNTRGPHCPYRYQEIEHTADRALRVWGERLPDLFVGAARGMADLMADLAGSSSPAPVAQARASRAGQVAVHWRRLQLEGLDRETLLVNWLNELLFIGEAEKLLFVEFQIESLDDTSLVARVGGVPAAPTKAQIKAATFHDLKLVEDGRGWSATITFDV